MPIGFNNFGGSFKTSGINSAKGKNNDGGSSGGTGYMRQRKKQQDEVQKDFDINGGIFGDEHNIGFHIPSEEEFEKMMNTQSKIEQNKTTQNITPKNSNTKLENQNVENNTNNFFNSKTLIKENENFFK